MKTSKAHYRKWKNSYKPLIKYSDNTSEVVDQSPERFNNYTKNGCIKGNRYAQGMLYDTKEEAIKRASEVIKQRLQETITRYEKYNKPEKMIGELVLWGYDENQII